MDITAFMTDHVTVNTPEAGPVHSYGQIIGFLLTAKWDVAARLRFFRQAIRHHGEPHRQKRCQAALNAGEPDEKIISIRQSKYLNNLVE